MEEAANRAQEFGIWLERQLRKQNMTQTALADMLNVTPAAVSAWVTGRAEPREDRKRAIAAALGTDEATVHNRTLDVVTRRPVQWLPRPAHADGGREFGNAAAFAFEADVAVLAREATQNSLDEQLDPSRPVRVRYTLNELSGEHLRTFQDALRWNEIEPHLEAAATQKHKVGRVIAEGLREMRESDTLLLLRVDDYNCTGLTGPDYGDDSKFAAVLRDQLNSHKDSGVAGGSYGLGKITLWATSRIGLVLVNSTLSRAHEGRHERRIFGRLELPWHETGGRAYAGLAGLGEADTEPGREGVARSWWADEETARSLYVERESRDPGTSFLIVGAHDAAGDAESLQEMHEKLVRSLADNFWAAMTSGRDGRPVLEASVTTLRNGQVVIPAEKVDPSRHQPARTRALKAFLDGETVEQRTDTTQVAMTHVSLWVPPRKDVRGRPGVGVEHKTVLLVTAAEDEALEPNRLVCMRGNRMTVMTRRVVDLPLSTDAFQAVLLAGRATGRKGEDVELAEMFLRASEPPEHNDWTKTEDLVTTYARGARARIDEFRKAMTAAVRGLVGRRETRPEGGPAVLRELLRIDAYSTEVRRPERHPVVRHVEGEVDTRGAWNVRVEVKLPRREDPWLLVPVAKFDVRSGGKPSVEWAKLNPGENCRVEDGILHFEPGVATASFSGVTDVASHPVTARHARLIIDLQKGKSVQA
ncbi:helix-turn-helix domain-containing protein [Streptomyces ipomoeae]|uniref:DNA-binding helix-turn-helix protein n=1 Tax=Streptomyces ipomoeae 91-03 TaxID=698759 RepID=L1L012_9ACTN|nr:helix-turn-helix transcriptional regulator [Streptomyces ipomoeae]EKX65938.1 DNA-binding helix-turn-helix protein [Streptomyces ipomoeae 91-03]MDX2697559.1 helix-turn-helix transcriptional regulator [Streptomyces ipomoeae]MDX2843324.1 helix-turn-helix transcriptional regulator [Streptomyces ipomoeae]